MSFNYMIKNNYTIYKNIIQYNKQYVVIKNVDILNISVMIKNKRKYKVCRRKENEYKSRYGNCIS